jgi:hypothetical protein
VGSDGFGGNGGVAEDGTAGGTGGSGSGAAGGAGSHGSGGGGGGGNSGATGGNGGNGIEWDASHGSGGGGGGGGGSSHGANGGTGGNYGGGGGGGGYSGPAKGAGGNGAQGLIVVTYTSAASAAVTAESWSALEAQETACTDQPAAIESGLTVPRDSRSQSEAGSSGWRSNAADIDFANVGVGDLRFSAEWAGAIATTVDALARLEAGARSSADASAPLEPASRAIREVAALNEWNAIDAVQTWPTVEQLATVGGDCAPPFECEGLLAVEAQACQECTGPPDPLLVSSERLLRSPARVRILASPGSLHPLRGQ